MGPKSENVEKALVLPLLFEGSRGHGNAKESLQPSEPGVREAEKVIVFDSKCFVSISKIVLPAWAGNKFQKHHENK